MLETKYDHLSIERDKYKIGKKKGILKVVIKVRIHMQ